MEVLDVLMKYIHPSSPTRAKLSVHLKAQAQAAGGVKFDIESAQPLIAAFTQHTIVVDQAALQGLMMSQPDLDAVKAFARQAVAATPGVTDDAKKELETMIDALKGKEPAPANGDVNGAPAELRKGNVYIEDIHAFKAGLIPSQAALPIEPLGPVAKL